MNPANAAAFRDPDYRLLAQGHSFNPKTMIWLDPHGHQRLLSQSGGILSPSRYELVTGTSLYKFTDSRQPADSFLSSGWWFERRELDHILNFAKQNNYPEGYAVRLLACVPPEWGSNLDLVVSTRMACDLLAYRGLAKSAVGRDGRSRTEIEARNDLASWRLNQLFVPGLREARTDKPTNNHRQWFVSISTFAVSNAFTWIYR